MSPSSRHQDREFKFRAFARGGIALYVLIDHYGDPSTITLFSRPGRDGYQDAHTAAAGQPLHLPAPFDLALDTARLLGSAG